MRTEANIDIDFDRDFVDTVVEEIVPEQIEASECASHGDNRLVELFDYALSWPPEDDTDEFAFPSSRSALFSASSDGIISIHHRHSQGITLTAAQARDLYEFLTNVAIIWRRAK